jgi:hypothetical protein
VTTHAAPRTQLLVALYGRSLMLSGLARRLTRHSHLDVVQVDGPDPADALRSLRPDALILDLDSVPIDSALTLLHDRPELILVGLEAAGARLLVLSGDRARAISTRGLIALLEGGRYVNQRTSQ